MKKLIFILFVVLSIGCASETAPAPEIDIDAKVKAKVDEMMQYYISELDKKIITILEATPTQESEKLELTPTPEPLPTTVAGRVPENFIPDPTPTPNPQMMEIESKLENLVRNNNCEFAINYNKYFSTSEDGGDYDFFTGMGSDPHSHSVNQDSNSKSLMYELLTRKINEDNFWFFPDKIYRDNISYQDFASKENIYLDTVNRLGLFTVGRLGTTYFNQDEKLQLVNNNCN